MVTGKRALEDTQVNVKLKLSALWVVPMFLYSDLQQVPTAEPFELAFDLLATSYLFKSGNRIRISVAFADADNFDTPILDPAPMVKLLRDHDHPSFVELPLVHNV